MRNYKSFIADFGLLYTSIIWGTTFFVVKDLVKYIDPVVLYAYRFLLAAFLLALDVVYLPHVTNVILFLTFFPTVSAFLIQLRAQKITHPVKVSLIFALEPVFGAIFAWTLGGEVYLFRQVIGGFLIFLSLVLLGLRLDLRGIVNRHKKVL